MNNRQETQQRVELKKSFSPFQVWALALGCILGWGCFVLPGIRFLPEAGPVAACLGFLIGAIMLLTIALSYGKMVANYPVAGGAFAYAFVGFGPTCAFICGWALVLGYLCIIALNATAIALLTRFLFPGVFEIGHLYTIAGWNVYSGELALLCGTVLLFGYVNYRGVGFAGSLQLVLALALIAGVVALCIGSFTYSGTTVNNLQPFFAEGKSAVAAVASIVAIAPWLYVGFDTIPQTAEEFDFPHEQSTKLMLGAILCGAFIYGLITVAVAIVIPYKELLDSAPVWATGTIVEITLGKVGAAILAVSVLAAILTGINGFFIAASRLIFSMARAGFLPRWFGAVHPKYHSPYNALLFGTALCVLAPWFGREALGWVVDMSAVGTIIAYGFTSLAAYKLFVANENIPGAAKGKTAALLGVGAASVCFLLLTVPASPAAMQWQSWACLVGWVILGILFYCFKAKNVCRLGVDEQCERILGNKDKEVFFAKDGAQKHGGNASAPARMRYAHALLIGVLVLAALLAGQAAFAQGAAKTLRMAVGDPEDSEMGVVGKAFKQYVEEKSNGAIQVSLHFDGELGEETDTVQAVTMGTLDMALVGIANVAPRVKELGVLTLPYIFDDLNDVARATSGAPAEILNSYAESAGFRIMAWTYTDFRHISNAKHPVTTLADMKGLKIRVPQNTALIETIKAFGAEPVVVPWGLTFNSLKKGIVDGHSYGYIGFHAMKFQDANQKYITETPFTYHLQPLIMSTMVLRKFSQEERQLLIDAGKFAQKHGLVFTVQETEKAKVVLKESGVMISKLEDGAEWRNIALTKVWPELADAVGGKRFINIFLHSCGKSPWKQ
ncbi:TRAP transporter substrate-binding protein DctP [Desulfovibrio sp. OttesenSCG-928-G15]|nr:TRAP transporter substrate-binding protein DctP [Desulfovibrio sp. OttesenSCG-928-G15]